MTRFPRLRRATRTLCQNVSSLEFGSPVTHVYNPLEYAKKTHDLYLRKWGDGPRPVLFLGMNPGPYGMAQTGVPFGEIASVRDWLEIDARIGQPADPHPRRPIDGFDCTRKEISGTRLWGGHRGSLGHPKAFFLPSTSWRTTAPWCSWRRVGEIEHRTSSPAMSETLFSSTATATYGESWRSGAPSR